jgi:hypothetical protein
MPITNYEKVDIYPLDADVQEEILQEQNECSFAWATRDHWPVTMVMSYVWRDGKFWLTATSQRPRIAALRRDDRVSLSVSSVGTRFGPAKTVTIKGRCAMRDDQPTKDWFYPALAAAILPGDEKLQRGFQRLLDSPRRLVFEVTPEKWFTYDATKMMEASMPTK